VVPSIPARDTHAPCRTRPLPLRLSGVVLIQTGAPDQAQRLLGPVLSGSTALAPLAGATSVLTGEAALSLYGVRGASTARADVLIADSRGVTDRSCVRLRRTSRWPPTLLVNGVPCARPVRAASDFAACEPSGERVLALLANTVQATGCHPEDLNAELRASHPRHAATRGSRTGQVAPWHWR
jgi:hypothetical protein